MLLIYHGDKIIRFNKAITHFSLLQQHKTMTRRDLYSYPTRHNRARVKLLLTMVSAEIYYRQIYWPFRASPNRPRFRAQSQIFMTLAFTADRHSRVLFTARQRCLRAASVRSNIQRLDAR